MDPNAWGIECNLVNAQQFLSTRSEITYASGCHILCSSSKDAAPADAFISTSPCYAVTIKQDYMAKSIPAANGLLNVIYHL